MTSREEWEKGKEEAAGGSEGMPRDELILRAMLEGRGGAVAGDDSCRGKGDRRQPWRGRADDHIAAGDGRRRGSNVGGAGRLDEPPYPPGPNKATPVTYSNDVGRVPPVIWQKSRSSWLEEDSTRAQFFCNTEKWIFSDFKKKKEDGR